jgi:hypothetical protein
MLEFAAGGAHARCTRCSQLFSNQNGQLTPIVVQAPGGGNNPQFNAMFAQQLGFGPPGAVAQPPIQPSGPSMPNVGVRMRVEGVPIDIGSGGINIDRNRLEDKIGNKITQKVDQKVFGCVLSIVIAVVALVILLGVGGYVLWTVRQSMVDTSSSAAPKLDKWDGKSTYTCMGPAPVTLQGASANLSSGTAISATGNCQLTLVNPSITAPVAIDANGNAKITITGGSITGSTNSIVVSGNAQLIASGTTVKGATKSGGLGKIVGVSIAK